MHYVLVKSTEYCEVHLLIPNLIFSTIHMGYCISSFKRILDTKRIKVVSSRKNVEPKEVFIYQTTNSQHCPVHIINYYLGKLPETRTCKAFYLQP